MLNNAALQDPASPKKLRSTLVSRNVTISDHRTSIRLEPEMWSGLSEICRREGSSLHDVCTAVALRKSENTSLTAAIRVFVMAYYRAAATEDGHGRAGHGCGTVRATTQPMAPQPAPQTARTSPVPDGITNRVYPIGNNRFR